MSNNKDSKKDKHADPPNISAEEAKVQFKTKLLGVLNFFKQVPEDVVSSSEKMIQGFTAKGSLLKVLSGKDSSGPEKGTQSVKRPQKTLEKGNVTEGNLIAHDDKLIEKHGEKQKQTPLTSSRLKEKQKNLKEENKNHQREKTQSHKEETSVRPQYNSLGDIFGSIKSFVVTTVSNIQRTSAEATSKLGSGVLFAAKAKKEDNRTNTHVKKVPEKPVRDRNPKKERIDELIKMKKYCEHQLQSLTHELTYLQQPDRKGNHSVNNALIHKLGEGRDSRTGQRKLFRVTPEVGSKITWERPEKSVEFSKGSFQASKKLPHLEDLSQLDKKSKDSEKTMKSSDSQPLFVKMEQEFIHKVVFPELEARKEKLKAKREFYRPMDEKELREHAIKYEEQLRKHEADKHIEKLEKQPGKPEKPIKLYKSIAFQKAVEQEKEEKAKADKKAEDRKLLKDKQIKYGQIVKEMFFPKVEGKDDPISKQNIQNLIERSLKANVAFKSMAVRDSKEEFRIRSQKEMANNDIRRRSVNLRYNLDRHDVYGEREHGILRASYRKNNSPSPIRERFSPSPVNSGNNFDQDIVKEEPKEESHEEIKSLIEKEKRRAESRPHPRITSNSPKKVDKSPEKSEPEVLKKSYPNYLDEIKKKRIEKEKKGIKIKFTHWEKHLKNNEISHKDKVLKILDDVNRMEFQAKLKEDKLKTHVGVEPLDLEEQVGEMYLESIKAKLAILSDLY